MQGAPWLHIARPGRSLDASTPLTNVYLAIPRPNDVAGFPCDEEPQRLRRSR